MRGTKSVVIVFIWLVSWMAATGLTNDTKFDWIASVIFYGGFFVLRLLVTSEDLRRPRRAGAWEASPTIGRLALIFLSIGVWLGSMLGVLTLLPVNDSITFAVWIVWSAILILFIWQLEKHWNGSYR
jgi:hypothetical protein